VTQSDLLRIEIDGAEPTPAQLQYVALNGYGHFTAMQVRGGAVRGLHLHLDRLSSANREMFDVELDGDEIRRYVRHALGDIADASVRVVVVWSDRDETPVVLVTVRPPGGLPSTPHRALCVPYQRPLPHLKQVGGGFGQIYYGRLAERQGFTEVLLTGPDGAISEGGITNVGFFDGSQIVWPNAPQLAGITMRLLESRLASAGLPTRHAAVHVADLPSFSAVFVTNSHGVAPVGRIDDLAVPIDIDLMKRLSTAYESVPWDRI
jgi:branched-subunit amino acid aminotransferase/4-amino-4-deoxychorismate lyase